MSKEALSKDENNWHTWVPRDTLIPWPHCSVCLIIKRSDGQNKPCKGAGHLRPVEVPRVR